MVATVTTLDKTKSSASTAASITVAAGDLVQCRQGRVRVSTQNTDSTMGVTLGGPNDTIKTTNAGTLYLWLENGTEAIVTSEPI